MAERLLSAFCATAAKSLQAVNFASDDRTLALRCHTGWPILLQAFDKVQQKVIR